MLEAKYPVAGSPSNWLSLTLLAFSQDALFLLLNKQTVPFCNDKASQDFPILFWQMLSRTDYKNLYT